MLGDEFEGVRESGIGNELNMAGGGPRGGNPKKEFRVSHGRRGRMLSLVRNETYVLLGRRKLCSIRELGNRKTATTGLLLYCRWRSHTVKFEGSRPFRNLYVG